MREAIAERLIDALVSRLNSVFPPGFTAGERDGVLILSHEENLVGGTFVAVLLDQDVELVPQLAAVAECVLSDVQNWIARELTTPWPASAHAMPMPGARVVGEVLELWYGETEKPTLSLTPINLAEIIG